MLARRFARLLLPAALAACASAASPDTLIVPGEGIGAVRLGQTPAEVRARMGEPTVSTAQTAHVPGNDAWLSGGHALGVQYRAGRVAEIDASSPRFRTADGITVRSRLPTIQQRYGPLQTRTWTDTATGAKIVYHDAVQHGVAFARSAPDSPEKSPSDNSVIVHPKGQPLQLEGGAD